MKRRKLTNKEINTLLARMPQETKAKRLDWQAATREFLHEVKMFKAAKKKEG
jgi:hypothetical protein